MSDDQMHGHRLRRLPREYYQGDAVVHWTQSIQARGCGWLTPALHLRFRELLLHVGVREGLLCPSYTLMEDHIHLVWMGLRRRTDQLRAIAFLRTHLEPELSPWRFQHQSHDHVLRAVQRDRGAFQNACSYILENPVRAGYVENARDWLFQGALIPGFPSLDPRGGRYWERFWPIYWNQLEADAGTIPRPPWGL